MCDDLELSEDLVRLSSLAPLEKKRNCLAPPSEATRPTTPVPARAVLALKLQHDILHAPDGPSHLLSGERTNHNETRKYINV